ncbi:nuclear transport factor 2 family protein [Streptodolium elevatio]|uniref:Nuclear transport factor 2 family protein n=1 Tax=Streptodolium elevatio TaxID=3157996 RepID=A0ABV3DR95_9ACTN
MHDRLAAHELLHRWWFVYDEGEFDAWEDLLTEDVWFTSRTDTGNHPHEEFIASDNRGREAVLAWQRAHRLASPYPLRHNGTNIHVIGETEDELSLSSYIHVTSVDDRVPSNIASGIVRAVARREEGVYRLAQVHVVLDTMKAVAFSER